MRGRGVGRAPASRSIGSVEQGVHAGSDSGADAELSDNPREGLIPTVPRLPPASNPRNMLGNLLIGQVIVVKAGYHAAAARWLPKDLARQRSAGPMLGRTSPAGSQHSRYKSAKRRSRSNMLSSTSPRNNLNARLSPIAAAILCIASGRSIAAQIPVPDTVVSSFHFTAMVLNSSQPSLSCIVTGAADMTATVNILVLLFEKADSQYPYAKVAGNALISPSNPRGNCNVDNGPQTILSIIPAKIEIQVLTNNAVLEGNVAVPLPASPASAQQ